MGIATALRKAHDLQTYVNHLGTNERAKVHIDLEATKRAVMYHLGEIEAAVGDKWAGAVKLVLKDDLLFELNNPRKGRLAADLNQPITRFITHFRGVLSVMSQNTPQATPEKPEIGYMIVLHRFTNAPPLNGTSESQNGKKESGSEADNGVISDQAPS